jgi:hypothetical protein
MTNNRDPFFKKSASIVFAVWSFASAVRIIHAPIQGRAESFFIFEENYFIDVEKIAVHIAAYTFIAIFFIAVANAYSTFKSKNNK